MLVCWLVRYSPIGVLVIHFADTMLKLLWVGEERTSSFFDLGNTSAVGSCASIVNADGQQASHLTAIGIQETV